MEPNFFGGHQFVGMTLAISKRFEEAIRELELAVMLGYSTFTLSGLGMVYGMMGEKWKAREVIEKMKSIEGAEIGGNCFVAEVFTSMGELDTAFQYYDKALDNREEALLWVKYFFQDNHAFLEDPRTQQLFKKMGVVY